MIASIRLPIGVLLSCVLAAALPPAATAQATRQLNLFSDILSPKVSLPESPRGAVLFRLTAKVDAKGEGQAKLILDPNARSYSELGDVTGATAIALIEFDCTLKYVKTVKLALGPPRFEQVERKLYDIKGEKITSRLSLVALDPQARDARLLIHDKDGKVTTVIRLYEPPPPEPCHPGCFPAGTLVQTPQGARPIETVRVGEPVTTVRPDGTTAAVKVQSVFVTPNRLLRVETDGGILLTTLTQPLCLAGGPCRAAGELKAGNRIVRWQTGKRTTVTVLAVALTDRQENVFNLVLGDCEVFIAGGFLARSKPPRDAVLSAAPTVSPGPAAPASKQE